MTDIEQQNAGCLPVDPKPARLIECEAVEPTSWETTLISLLHLVRWTEETLPVAALGTPVTILWYTDRTVGRVIARSKSGKTATIQIDDMIQTDSNGLSGPQWYDYRANPNGARYTARLGKQGSRIGGRSGLKVLVGVRDFSF